MKTPTVIFRVAPDTVFSDWSPVLVPIADPISHTRTALEHENEHAFCGVWECTPGTWRRQVIQPEYSYFIQGRGSFTHDHGEVVHFQAGDAIFFPAQSTGIWHIAETVQKSYVIFKMPNSEEIT